MVGAIQRSRPPYVAHGLFIGTRTAGVAVAGAQGHVQPTLHTWAAINRETTAIITAISSGNGCDVLFVSTTIVARTTALITKAWITMLQTEMAGPARSSDYN
jgi:hypothetical protein